MEYDIKMAKARNKIAQKLKKRERAERMFLEIKSRCPNFNNINLTCIRCLENGEEKYRGCFKK